MANYAPIAGSATFGNIGSRYTSDYIAGVIGALNMPYGTQLTADFIQGIPGLKSASYGSTYQQKGVSASIVTPYGIYDVTANVIRYRLCKATYPLNPDGKIYTITLDGAQLLFADDTTKAVFTESLASDGDKEDVLNGYYTILQQPYKYLSASSSLSKSFGGTQVDANLSFTAGISGAQGTLRDNVAGLPTSHFRYMDVQLGYQRQLPLGLQLSLSAKSQISANTLPVQQQFVLGGLSALSAWEPGILTGDSGYQARLEIQHVLLRKPPITIVVGPFFETVASSFIHPAPGAPPWQMLADCGIDFKLALPYRLSATVAVAVPVSESGFQGPLQSNLRLNRTSAFFDVQKDF